MSITALLKNDNESEFVGKILGKRVYERGIRIDFSRPGTLVNNVTVKSFNGRLRQECLNEYWFISLLDDVLGICQKICQLSEYAASMKPIISDYKWITIRGSGENKGGENN